MKNKNKIKDEYINDEDLKRYIDLSPEKKLEYLEEMNLFLNAAMPPENKRIAKKLREEGF
ncbi:MAG: hypothetical protein HYZ79_04870 [Candidatus Melainabacteria bacterium]|nr:hypothetical protein [Candidatus Melainabacteria bacterium]